MSRNNTGFVGEYLHNLDNKGRLALPIRFREILGPYFIIARGFDKCLYVYSTEEWGRVMEQINSLSLSQKDSRAISRYFLSGASECETDKQGRIVLPLHLREYAGLTGDVYCLGVGTRVEIWDKNVWENMKLEMQDSFASLIENITNL